RCARGPACRASSREPTPSTRAPEEAGPVSSDGATTLRPEVSVNARGGVSRISIAVADRRARPCKVLGGVDVGDLSHVGIDEHGVDAVVERSESHAVDLAEGSESGAQGTFAPSGAQELQAPAGIACARGVGARRERLE